MSWIQTYTGREVYPDKPETIDFNIEDIARSLSRQCRYTGHIVRGAHYSVAEHSVLASYIVPPAYAREALMHDAAEAYTGDIAKPIKTEEQNIREDLIMDFIRYKFKLEPRYSIGWDLVKIADLSLLMAERDALMPEEQTAWWRPDKWLRLDHIEFYGYSSELAYHFFMKRYKELFECELKSGFRANPGSPIPVVYTKTGKDLRDGVSKSKLWKNSWEYWPGAFVHSNVVSTQLSPSKKTDAIGPNDTMENGGSSQ